MIEMGDNSSLERAINALGSSREITKELDVDSLPKLIEEKTDELE